MLNHQLGLILSTPSPFMADHVLGWAQKNILCGLCHRSLQQREPVLTHWNPRLKIGCYTSFCQHCAAKWYKRSKPLGESHACPSCSVSSAQISEYWFSAKHMSFTIELPRSSQSSFIFGIPGVLARTGVETTSRTFEHLATLSADLAAFRLACMENASLWGTRLMHTVYIEDVLVELLRRLDRCHKSALPTILREAQTIWQCSTYLGIEYWTAHQFGRYQPYNKDLSPHLVGQLFYIPQYRNARLRVARNWQDIQEYARQDLIQKTLRFGHDPLPTWMVCRLIRCHWSNLRLGPPDPDYDVETQAESDIANVRCLADRHGIQEWAVLETPDPRWKDPEWGIVDLIRAQRLRHSAPNRNIDPRRETPCMRMYWIIPWSHGLISKLAEYDSRRWWTKCHADAEYNDISQGFSAYCEQVEDAYATTATGAAFWWGQPLPSPLKPMKSLCAFADVSVNSDAATSLFEDFDYTLTGSSSVTEEDCCSTSTDSIESFHLPEPL